MTLKHLKIGTRGSPLALKQTEMVIAALKRQDPEFDAEVVVIKTSGDWKPEHGDTPLPSDDGGKGQFAKEIEKALLDGAIDCGVHSVKDMPGFLPDGLSMDHFLPRNDPRDALLAQKITGFEDIPVGAKVGTCSPRRAAILLNARPDLQIVPLRGNVHTRIQKLCSGQVDVTLLAMAGLNRLGLGQGVEHGKVAPIPVEMMLPACGQGAIGIEVKDGRADVKALLDNINCHETASCVLAERTVLQILNGSCQTPIAAYAVYETGHMHLRAKVGSLDGTQFFECAERLEMDASDRAAAKRLGESVGESLKGQVPDALLAA